jgi:hypothetical protein
MTPVISPSSESHVDRITELFLLFVFCFVPFVIYFGAMSFNRRLSPFFTFQ